MCFTVTIGVTGIQLNFIPKAASISHRGLHHQVELRLSIGRRGHGGRGRVADLLVGERPGVAGRGGRVNQKGVAA